MIHHPHPHLEVLVGIPGSGKSTYATHRKAHAPATRIISPDDIRNHRYPGYHQGQVAHQQINHRLIFRLAYRKVAQALAAGKDVIFDATSLTVRNRHRLIVLGRRYHAYLIAHYFPISLHEAQHRNSTRPRQVPHDVMAQMQYILEPPTCREGFHSVVQHDAVE